MYAMFHGFDMHGRFAPYNNVNLEGRQRKSKCLGVVRMGKREDLTRGTISGAWITGWAGWEHSERKREAADDPCKGHSWMESGICQVTYRGNIQPAQKRNINIYHASIE